MQANYANAWLEFTSAYQLVPLTALLNNMARCEVKIGRPVEALQHFRAFIAAEPNDPDGEEIRREIARLEGEVGRRAATTDTGTPGDSSTAGTAAPVRRVPVAGIAVGVASLATLLAGVATIGLVSSRYGDLDTICKPTCPTADVHNLQQQSYAGYGLLAVGGAGVIVSSVILAVQLRRPKESTLRPIAALRLGAPLGLGGSF